MTLTDSQDSATNHAGGPTSTEEKLSPEVVQAAYEALYHPHAPPPAVRETLLDDGYFAWLDYSRYTVQLPWLRAEADFTSRTGQLVLEVGCGVGQDLNSFANHGATVVGVDIDPAACVVANRLLTHKGMAAAVTTADGRQLPFHDGIFDHVFVCDLEGAIGAMTALHPFSQELVRVLRPGGDMTLIRSHQRIHVLDNPRDSWKATEPAVLPIAGARPIITSEPHQLSADDDPHPGLAVIDGFYGLWRLVTQRLPSAIISRLPDRLVPTVRRIGRPIRALVEAPFRAMHALGDWIRSRDLTAPARRAFEWTVELDRGRRDNAESLRTQIARWLRSTNPTVSQPISTRNAIGADPQIARKAPRLQRLRYIGQRGRPLLRLIGATVALVLLVVFGTIALVTWPLRRLIRSGANRLRMLRLTRRIRPNLQADLYHLNIDRDRTVIKLRAR